MAVSVHLDFIAPNVPDLTSLRIYEAPAKDGPWSMIETVTPVGSYGNYLSEYTTNAATSTTDWFAIEWLDSKGASFGQSQGVQAGAESAVSEITDRVLLRDASVSEAVAEQEAEAVVSDYFGTDDPLSIPRSAVTASEFSGLTMLTMARAKLFQIYSGTGSSADYVAGLVSQKVATSAVLKYQDVKNLIDAANVILGSSYSVIVQMEEVVIAGGSSVVPAIPDQTRLLVEVI
jgi:hypothetical protein